MSDYPKLTDSEWEGILKRLSLYAQQRSFGLWWRGVRPDPADIAATAICKVVEGTRTWDGGHQPDFVAFLMSVVDSEISPSVMGCDNRKRSGETADDIADSPSRTSRQAAPDRRLVDSDNANEAEQFRSLVLREIGNDELVVSIFDCVNAGTTKPSEIAVLLDREVKDINNAQKRLRRKFETALRKQKGRLHV